ncbi:Zn(II)2Cys6 transcription factor [Aspergillus alliaceus]|uniref:Zn(II)2Cys6 transcription factor n=1 Tax=Petromyces alliaceus TaxID=209559 RepID=UPI0012A714CB|nr:uncharacterized protein BDW43DRAFT_321136 [Aspergillus alliaceus]KAB8237954.1 hypothetical protein BDW43DRAFT_321136 [Aspergillus alliaceus]
MKMIRAAQDKRKRIFSRKSKTGCRTCRTRRIKCDETPGTCRNCSSTGRICAYDAQRLPRTRLLGGRPPPIPPMLLTRTLPAGFWWGMTSDERRCYSFFQHRTCKAVIGYFDSDMWERLVLQVSQTEQAVYHAVIAFGATHADFEARGMPPALDDMSGAWHRFAIDQGARSYAHLNARSASHDPKLREVILVCCVLFVISELVRGQFDLALTHLKNGLRILKDTVEQFHAFGCTVDRCLLGAFAHLNEQAVFFGAEALYSLMKPEPAQPPPPPGEGGLGFRSLPESRTALLTLLNGLAQEYSSSSAFSQAKNGTSDAALTHWQFNASLKIRKFSQMFELFHRRAHERNNREQRGIDLFYMHILSLSVSFERKIYDRTGGLLEYDTPIFERLVSLAEAFIDSFHGPDRPGLLLGLGVIAPLFYVATRCRQNDLRWRAIRALHSWPHREGPWSSDMAASIAVEIIAAEKNVLQTTLPVADPGGPYWTGSVEARQGSLSFMDAAVRGPSMPVLAEREACSYLPNIFHTAPFAFLRLHAAAPVRPFATRHPRLHEVRAQIDAADLRCSYVGEGE